MAKLEIFVSGVFGKTGEDAYQIGSKNEDGTYTITVFDLMTKAQAEAKLNEVQPSAPKKAAPKLPSKEELTGMSKDALEVEMRKHGLELDRRKTKDTLVKQAVSFLKGK